MPRRDLPELIAVALVLALMTVVVAAFLAQVPPLGLSMPLMSALVIFILGALNVAILWLMGEKK